MLIHSGLEPSLKKYEKIGLLRNKTVKPVQANTIKITMT